MADAAPASVPRLATDWDALSLKLAFGAIAFVGLVFLVAPTLIEDVAKLAAFGN